MQKPMDELRRLHLMPEEGSSLGSPSGHNVRSFGTSSGEVHQRVSAALRASATAIRTASSTEAVFERLLRQTIPNIADWGAVFRTIGPVPASLFLATTYPFAKPALNQLLDLGSRDTRELLGVREAAETRRTQRPVVSSDAFCRHLVSRTSASRAAIAAVLPRDVVTISFAIDRFARAVLVLARCRDSYSLEDQAVITGLRRLCQHTLTQLTLADDDTVRSTGAQCH